MGTKLCIFFIFTTLLGLFFIILRNFMELYDIPVFVYDKSYFQGEHSVMLKWELSRKYSSILPVKLQTFSVKLSEENYQIYMDLLKTFTSVMEKNKLTYFLYGGSLLGSIRHRDIIPWDDEIDLMINASEETKIVKVMKKLEPKYKLYSTNAKQSCWKFYSEQSKYVLNKLVGTRWKWPFLDLWLFDEFQNGTIFDISLKPRPLYYQKNVTFPLKRRPFGNFMPFTPKEPEKFLGDQYDLTQCVSPNYNHAIEFTLHTSITVPCSKLHDFYPFVKKTTTEKHFKETLVLPKDYNGLKQN